MWSGEINFEQALNSHHHHRAHIHREWERMLFIRDFKITINQFSVVVELYSSSSSSGI